MVTVQQVNNYKFLNQTFKLLNHLELNLPFNTHINFEAFNRLISGMKESLNTYFIFLQQLIYKICLGKFKQIQASSLSQHF